MTANHSCSVERSGDKIILHALDTPFVVGEFIRAVHHGRQEGHTSFELHLRQIRRCFPNACTPMAGLLEYYRDECGLRFIPAAIPEFLTHCGLLSPWDVRGVQATNATSAVWRFSSSAEIHAVVSAYLHHVSRIAECQAGVLQGLEWCLSEVMDNVVQHAGTRHGYVMGQIHNTSRHIAICVYDHGCGLFNSLRGSRHQPATPRDAVVMALREGVTRDATVGQGNGLWGLSRIVASNSGLLNVSSGPAFLGLSGDQRMQRRVHYLSPDNHCTTVDFQIDFHTPIFLPDALGGYEPVNLRIENMEDGGGNVVFRLADQDLGTGTREAGLVTRNEVANAMNQTDAPIVLDFGDVPVVASSFADELVGKLALGNRIVFESRIRLVGMNGTVRAIVNRSLAQRLSSSLLDEDIDARR